MMKDPTIPKEEIDKLINELVAGTIKIAAITNVIEQMIAFNQWNTEFIGKVWKMGYDAGLKDGQNQKSSIVIKRLTDEN